jgi:23S rRNA (guanosine2251-2'-O)-methyltransferase
LADNTITLYGKNSVFERLKANSGSIKKIFLQENFDVPHIEKLINENNISVERLSQKQLARIKHTRDFQGIIAEVEGFGYIPFDELLLGNNGRKSTIVFLDRIFDPHNLGAIIRTLACFGGFSVVIPRFNACEVNETVLHVASGGENYVPVSMVTNLSKAIIKAKEHGYWIIGAVVSDDAKDINKISLPHPTGIVFGSEGEGVRYGVEKHLDIKARIPMEGAKLSFNVTMACAIFCHEIAKQRR